jgi:NAD(P)-dependent dehydrogenase (short-subunit alcohol dehydrogenase family)
MAAVDRDRARRTSGRAVVPPPAADVARAIAMLVGADAGFVTGSVIAVDGGHGLARR